MSTCTDDARHYCPQRALRRSSSACDSDSDFCIGDALGQAECAPPLEVNEFRAMDASLEAKLARLLECTLRFLALVTSPVPASTGLAGATYWACGGTLLGAARHGGFIPWDDDIDFSLLVPDGAAVRAADLRAAARECGLCVCDADSVGLRLFLLPIDVAATARGTTRSPDTEIVGVISTDCDGLGVNGSRHQAAIAQGALPFPFCDVFLLQRGAAVKRAALRDWCAQYAVRVASRALGGEIRAAPTEDDARAAWCVLADATGRELWPAEAYPLADVCGPLAIVATLPFHTASLGSIQIPVPRNVAAYLDVTYGVDWQTTARTHNLAHCSGATVVSQCAPLVEALFMCAIRTHGSAT